MPKKPTIQELIDHFDLEPMEAENLRFRRTYAHQSIGPDSRPIATAIIAMLTDEPESMSDMHRLTADEMWHFYFGDPVELLLLYPDGTDELVILGHDVLAGQKPQQLVPGGVWMGARIRSGGHYAVFGNTVSPGFVQEDFEGTSAEALIEQWPQQASLIRALTRY
ncbi:MAG: cupin domain-containing protein [Pseudomonadota bacterium]